MIYIMHRAQDKENIPARFGVELDVRDCDLVVMVSHDMIEWASDDKSIYDWLCDDVRENGIRPIYAINVKCDGIEEELKQVYIALNIPEVYENTFFFDMSYPSMIQYEKLDMPVAKRVSEEESWYDHCSPDVWLDRWDWDEDKKIELPTWDFSKIYAVSPELHIECDETVRRDWWKQFWYTDVTGICTDYPEDCEAFINGLELNSL